MAEEKGCSPWRERGGGGEGEERERRREREREMGERRERGLGIQFLLPHSLTQRSHPLLGVIVEVQMEARSKTLAKLPVYEDEEAKRMEAFPIINL